MAQNLWLVFLGAVLGGGGFSFTNPVQMAALSATPLEQRGMLAGISPSQLILARHYSSPCSLLGWASLMANYQVANPGAAEADALSYALSILSWISLVVMVITLLVSFKLPKLVAMPSASPVEADLKTAGVTKGT